MDKKDLRATQGKTVCFGDRGGNYENFDEAMSKYTVTYYLIGAGIFGITLLLDDLLAVWGDSPEYKAKIEDWRGSHTLTFNACPEFDVIALERFLRLMEGTRCEDEPNTYIERAWSLHEAIIDTLI